MLNMALHIYYRKKYLRRSLTWHFFGLCVWVGLYFILIFPRILNRHPNVGENTHLILCSFLTVMFAAYSLKLVLVLIGCVSEYRKAPNIAYSLTKDGVRASRRDEYISWEDVRDAASMAKNDGFYLRRNLKSGFCIDSWGINPDEMKKAKGYIFQSLPKNRTKRLNF